MTKQTTQKKILELLKTSTIDDHTKKVTEILLPVMKVKVLNDILAALEREKDEMAKIKGERERIAHKYKVMVEKLAEMEINKYK